MRDTKIKERRSRHRRRPDPALVPRWKAWYRSRRSLLSLSVTRLPSSACATAPGGFTCAASTSRRRSAFILAWLRTHSMLASRGSVARTSTWRPPWSERPTASSAHPLPYLLPLSLWLWLPGSFGPHQVCEITTAGRHLFVALVGAVVRERSSFSAPRASRPAAGMRHGCSSLATAGEGAARLSCGREGSS